MYELLKGRHDEEIVRRKELDDKTSNLMAYVSIITGLTIALGTSSFRDALALPQFYVTYFFGIGLLLGSVITALIASRVMKWRVVPDIRMLMKEDANSTFTKTTLVNKRITELVQAIDINHDRNESKARGIMVSWCFLVAGLITLVIFLFILVITPNNPPISATV